MTDLDDFLNFLDSKEYEICYHSPYDGLVSISKQKAKELFLNRKEKK